MAVLPARVLFGAAYYVEYQPYERLKTDLMVDARFTVIRRRVGLVDLGTGERTVQLDCSSRCSTARGAASPSSSARTHLR